MLHFSAITNGALQPSTTLTLQEKNLVRCLTYISHRYFPPGRSLLMSSPGTYRDLQQELIAEIHRSSIWPVVVTVDRNISIPEKSDFIDRDGSYIILIPDGNINNFKAEINGLAEQSFRYTRLWNSEARFVVAGANEFSVSQQIDIFDHFSKFRIYNCIIVCQGHDIIYKEHSRPINVNDVDKGIRLGVYTWFPYKSSGSCTEVNDITLLDRWVNSAQGHFTKNTDLFPRKISNSLNGCPMKAFVVIGQSYFTTMLVKHTYPNGTYSTCIGGLEYDLLNVVLERMNMSFMQVMSQDSLETVKIPGENLINAMIGKEVYIAFGGSGKKNFMPTQFDYTNSYYMLRFRWYVPCSVKYPRWSSIFRILSVELWIVLIISILIATISATLVGRHSFTSEWQGYKTLTNSFTKVWAVILGVSVLIMPRTPSLRSLFLAWVCFSMAFSTVFQAFLTTFLIDSGYKTPIQNMDEMFDSGIKVAYLPEHSFIFENGDETELSKLQRNRANCPSFYECVLWAIFQKNVSVLLIDNFAEVNYARGGFIGENSEPLVCRLEDGVVFSTDLSMIMFHGDPLMRRINEIIDRVVEAGLYNYWISLNTNKLKLEARKIAIVHPLDGYYSFNLYHMQPAFYILLMGLCLSVLCFLIELLYIRILS